MSHGHGIEIALQLFDVLKSILTSNAYAQEYVTILDYSKRDTKIDSCEEDSDKQITDLDYREEDSKKLIYENFSFDYMKQALEFSDDIDQKTGKQQYNWKSIKHKFKQMLYQYYLARFGTYVEENGIRK